MNDNEQKILSLLQLWEQRAKMCETVLNTEGIILGLIGDILKEQERMQKEHGFWWHIKAAFIALVVKW